MTVLRLFENVILDTSSGLDISFQHVQNWY